MNVFITGISGFVGSRLMHFIDQDKRFDKVYCLCRKKTDLPSRFIAVCGSLENLSSVPPVDADVCIHMAAITTTVNAKPESILKTNGDGTKEVVEYCRKSNIRRLVFLSTVNVHLSKLYAYAQSKKNAEEYIIGSNLQYSILRCALIYGDGCNIFNTLTKCIKLLHIVPVCGKGNACEQPVYVDEVCHALIRHALQTEGNSIRDLCGKTAMSYNEMVHRLAAAIDKKVFLLHLPTKPIAAVATFCYNKNIPFPISPEQILHMCEDLHSNNADEDDDYLCTFEENLKKYM